MLYITHTKENNYFQMSKAFFLLVVIASEISKTKATCHNTEIGDMMEGQVLDHPNRPCQRYICQNDTLITVNSGCVFNGTCYRIDSEWQSGCQTYTCDVKFKNNTVWYISEVKVPRCEHRDKCFEKGQEWIEKCGTYTCKVVYNNGIYICEPIRIRQECTDIHGNCHGSGETFPFNCTGIPCDCTCETDDNPVRYRCQVPNVK
ncbi:unnamed protein product [Mytilus coruscus]|uniref:Uncharacterized protein n=1 Tax=Mytilus coruscus TaxID=42192 RepID=A0A6J8CTQ4_MYTCO|nr:unnamed protein product [Mytilus coruscus]